LRGGITDAIATVIAATGIEKTQLFWLPASLARGIRRDV
jgi:hypothetical protein